MCWENYSVNVTSTLGKTNKELEVGQKFFIRYLIFMA